MRIRQQKDCFEIRTPAKINLCLDVLGRRSDGFHELDTIISPVSLFDTLQFCPRTDERLQLKLSSTSYVSNLPTDESNLIIRALNQFREQIDGPVCGFDITLTKRIPSPSGLGGGSSNAAGAILLADHIWRTNLTSNELIEIGATIGSDVPCFFAACWTRCRGRGEIVEPLFSAVGPLAIVIVSPQTGLPTANVFQQFAKTSTTADNDCKERGATRLLQAIELGTARGIARAMSNGLTDAARALTTTIEQCETAFEQLPTCLGHQMSGSGTSYFGIFPTQKTARLASKKLAGRLPTMRVSCVSTLNSIWSQEFPRRQELDRSLLCE